MLSPTVLSVPACPCQALVSVRPLACQERRFSQLLNSTDTTERDAGMLPLLRPPGLVDVAWKLPSRLRSSSP
jgi:hypothetical protein